MNKHLSALLIGGLIVFTLSFLAQAEPPSLSNLVAQLSSSNVSDRIAAVGILGETTASGTAAWLSEAAHDDAQEVRRAVLRVLTDQSTPESSCALIDMLKDQDSYIRQNAAVALGAREAPAAVTPLLGLVGEESAQVARSAEEAVRRIRDPAAVPAYAQALNDPSPRVREVAVDMLRVIGDPRAIESLPKTLKDDEIRVRRRTVDALASFQDERVKEVFVDVLRSHPDGYARRIAAHYLGSVGDPKVLEVLIPALCDQETGVGVEAAKSLASYPEPRAVEPLIMTFRDKELSKITVGLIQSWPVSMTREPLLAATAHENASIRSTAVKLISGWPDEQAMQRLFVAVADAQGLVRAPAIDALVKSRDPRASELFMTGLTHSNRAVRQDARTALIRWYGKDYGLDARVWREKTKPPGLFPTSFPIGSNRLVAVAKLAVLWGLVWLLRLKQQPFLCAAIYAMAYILLSPWLGMPLMTLLLPGVTAISFSILYFWILFHFAGETLIWWPVFLSGAVLAVI
ncbi:MAG TPA: hypothetical protein DCZ95_07160 [Verrucomicrobia bacterium]|nr:MAG: hypothetical protein A2X46_05510 [Lentisphaerae bacterium GWF2_57_35]HBA83853.1 hypothetical protein [Verrucomicrobiota bacterium]